MRKSLTLCCDANIVVRFGADKQDRAVQSLFDEWRRDGRRIVAPQLFRFEVTNALYRLRRANVLSADSARDALEAALRLPIELISSEEMHQQASDIAARFNRPAAYDAHYLALAESLGADFWTADQRLFNTVQHELPWVHLVGS